MICFERDQLLEAGLRTSVSAPVPAQQRTQEYEVGGRGPGQKPGLGLT